MTATPRRIGYSIAEVAEMTGVSIPSLRARVHRRTVPSIRLGRSVLIPATYIERLVAAGDSTAAN